MEGLETIALAQIEVVPNDPDTNIATMKRIITQERDRGTKLVVFPELCISGYMVGEQWSSDAYVRRIAQYNDEVVAASEGMTVVWGNVAFDETKKKQNKTLRIYNALFVAHDGVLLEEMMTEKTLLPTREEFADARHFTSRLQKLSEDGKENNLYKVHDIPIGNETLPVGLTICADLWWDPGGRKMGEELRRKGAKMLINIAFSPWTRSKVAIRTKQFQSAFDGEGIPILYCNCIGMQDIGKTILALDGQSMIFDGNGHFVEQAPAFEEMCCRTTVPVMQISQDREIARTRCSCDSTLTYTLQKFFHRTGKTKAVLGLSGGIDSATVAALCSRALGPENVYCISMPGPYTSDTTKKLSKQCAENLSVHFEVIDINDLFSATVALLAPDLNRGLTTLEKEHIQARIRGSQILAGYAAKHDALITCNANKTEIAFGYGTLYGDLVGAIAPIGDLLKGEVYDLAREINDEAGKELIPEGIFSLPPSAELSKEQSVDDGNGDPFWYPYHDQLVRHFVEDLRQPEEILKWYENGELDTQCGFESGTITDHFTSTEAFESDLHEKWNLFQKSSFKRFQAPPIIKVSKRAFGFDLYEFH